MKKQILNKQDEFNQIKSEREIYEYLSKKAIGDGEQDLRLYHYTNFENLVSIISHKTFKLTRSDKLNDKVEQRIGNTDHIWNNYVMSMTGDKEYISMWSMYGKKSGIKLRLDFSRNELIKVITQYNNCPDNCNNFLSIDTNQTIKLQEKFSYNLFDKEFLCDNPIRFAYVAYFDKKKRKLKFNDKTFNAFQVCESKIEDLTGFIKYDAWEFEKEIRLFVKISDSNYGESYKPECIYLPITEDLIKTFSITFSPCLSNEIKNIVIKQLNELANCALKYKDSDNDGEIDKDTIY